MGFFFGAEAECLDGEIVVTAVVDTVEVGIANGIGELRIGVDGGYP